MFIERFKPSSFAIKNFTVICNIVSRWIKDFFFNVPSSLRQLIFISRWPLSISYDLGASVRWLAQVKCFHYAVMNHYSNGITVYFYL